MLLRAAAIEAGIDVARLRRGDAARPAALARGPGNLCRALGITMEDNGIDLFDPESPVRLTLGEENDATDGPRVGVSKAADRPVAVLAGGSPGGVAVPAQPAGTRAGCQRLSQLQCRGPQSGAAGTAAVVSQIDGRGDLLRRGRDERLEVGEHEFCAAEHCE